MSGSRYRTVARAIALLGGTAACACLCACGQQAAAGSRPDAHPPAHRAGRGDLPTLAEVRPAVSPYRDPAADDATVVRRPIVIQKLVFDRDDGRVDLALDALDPVDLPNDLAERWRVNGLHLSRLPAERLAMWSANVPEPAALAGVNVMPGVEYGTITLVGRMVGRHFVRFTEPGGRTSTRQFVGGQYDLLMKLTRPTDEPDRVLIDIQPHHVGPYDMNPLESARPEEAGTRFEALRVLTDAPRNEAWLIWSDTQPEDVESTVVGGEGETNIGPPRLGRAMMTGVHDGKAVRLVLVVLVP